MNTVKIKSYAKLNLFLDIKEKENNNSPYHEIEFINCNLALHDTITLSKNNTNKITIHSTEKKVPTDCQNFCYKIAEKTLKKYNISSGLNIIIEKKIPFIGGLGGGSANAASTLKGINSLFNLKLQTQEQIKLVQDISTDSCYSLIGGTSLIQGIGNKVTKLNDIPKLHVILIRPQIKLPKDKTRWMYSKYDEYIKKQKTEKTKNKINDKNKTINTILEGIKKQNSNIIMSEIHNSFTQIPIKEYKESYQIIEHLKKNGCSGATLCGSGPTVFGISQKQNIIDNISKDPKISKYSPIITSTL